MASLPPPGLLLDAPLASVLRCIRSAADALEAGRSAQASRALGEAAQVIVFVHTRIDALEGGREVTRAFRWIALRLRDADLLRDPFAAREAERALLMLARALRAGRETPLELA